LVNVATRRVRALPATGSDVAWSPDGRYLAMVDFDEDGRSAIYVLRSDGSGLAKVLTSPRSICCLDWKRESR
jgi:Tol biopolymer transport system component